MNADIVNKYLEQLEEVKQRGHVFQEFSSGKISAIYDLATVEVETRQLQGILELLAFGFVLSIGESAIPIYADFMRYGNSEAFLNSLTLLCKDFYPQPVLERRAEDGVIYWDSPAPTSWLSQNDFLALFAHCELVLGRRKVGQAPISIEDCRKANKRWYTKIVGLLNTHLIDTGAVQSHLFQMCVAGERPTHHLFEVKSIDSKYRKATAGPKPIRPEAATVLDAHLERQLRFLQRSADLFDAGHHEEALRMAVTIRVLVHDTKHSKSLLRQLGKKSELRLVTSFNLSVHLPENFVPTLILPLFSDSRHGVGSVPFALQEPIQDLPVDAWWDEVVWLQSDPITRKMIVLAAANKEGGAHVEALNPILDELRQGIPKITSVKVDGVERGMPVDYHFRMLRQFVHELLHSPQLTEIVV